MNEQELLAQLKTAFRLQRLRPVRGVWFLRRKRYDMACPLTALLLHRGLLDRSDSDALEKGDLSSALDELAKEFSMPWLQGFSDAFDRQMARTSEPAYLTGYKFGERVAQEILPGESPLGL